MPGSPHKVKGEVTLNMFHLWPCTLELSPSERQASTILVATLEMLKMKLFWKPLGEKEVSSSELVAFCTSLFYSLILCYSLVYVLCFIDVNHKESVWIMVI